MDDKTAIVVVQDDASMSHAIERLLKAASWRPRLFDSAEALLDPESANDAECFIFDINLPGLSGLQLRARLRDLEIFRPIFFITGYDHPTVRREAESVSAGYFLKPFQDKNLIAAISQVTDQAHA